MTLLGFPWANPEEFNDLPILAPAGSHVELISPDGDGKPLYIQTPSDMSGPAVELPMPSKWLYEYRRRGIPTEREGIRANWVPIDTLMDAYSFRASQMAREEQSPESRSEVFEGSLYDGLDLKPTLRSAARGEDRVYVRRSIRMPAVVADADDIDGFPVVWIIGNTPGSVDWSFSSDSLSTLRRFRSRER